MITCFGAAIAGWVVDSDCRTFVLLVTSTTHVLTIQCSAISDTGRREAQ